MEYVSPEGLRGDGRRPSDLRRLMCNIGVFEAADGSAYIEHGNTKVFAVVYGPSEPLQATNALHDRLSFHCEYSVAPFSSDAYRERLRRRGGSGDKEMELLITKTFEAAVMSELYPRSAVTICIEILQSDGGNAMAAINAANLALIDAGIAMKDFVVSCTAACIDGTCVLDPNQLEANAQGAELVIASMPKSGKIVSTQMASRIHVDNFKPLLDLAQSGCADLYSQFQKEVTKRTSQLSVAVDGGN
eukprot:m.20366 g.20366  ORF g.20366 m.20366 type:complete len:246 (-) comp6825_c0_seq1:153-890(-)